jgi:hypothetical protein
MKDTGRLGVTVTGNERPLRENLEELMPAKLPENADKLAPVASVCLPPVPTTTLPTLTELAFTITAACRKPQMTRGRRWTRDQQVLTDKGSTDSTF